MEGLRKKAIEEIINSEKNYLKQLEIVEEFFRKLLQENEILAPQTYASIFGDILGIRQVNKELLIAMETSTDKIGKVFLDLAPYLKFYSTYANDFKTAANLVEDQLLKNKPFKTFMERQESRPEVCKKLNALLIAPKSAWAPPSINMSWCVTTANHVPWSLMARTCSRAKCCSTEAVP